MLLADHGEGLAVVGFRERYVITKFGQLRIRRRLYRDRQGQGHFLLDEAIGLEKRSPLSPGLRDLSALLGSYVPFGKSEALLRLLLPVGVSHTTVHRQVARIADPVLAREKEELSQVFEQGKLPDKGKRQVDILFVEGDGVSIALQREKARRAELKIGISYEGWEKVGNHDRYRLKEKTAYLGMMNGEHFWEGFSLALARKYDLSRIGRVVVGGDGASWVKEGAGMLGGYYQLDRFHLRRELLRALQGDMEVVRKVYQACCQGDAKAADSILAKVQGRSSTREALEIAHLRAYLLDNATGLADYRLKLRSRDTTGLRGLGAMEGNVDKLAANRMKKRGMSWTKQGIRRMACLIQLQQSGQVCSWPGGPVQKPAMVKKPAKIHPRLDEKLSHYATYLNMGLPALSGPHSDRTWVKALRNFSYGVNPF